MVVDVELPFFEREGAGVVGGLGVVGVEGLDNLLLLLLGCQLFLLDASHIPLVH